MATPAFVVRRGAGMKHLRMESRASGSSLILRVQGDVDSYTAGHLDDVLEDLAEAQDQRRVVLDLERVTSFDRHGADVVRSGRRRLVGSGVSVSILASPTVIRSVAEPEPA